MIMKRYSNPIKKKYHITHKMACLQDIYQQLRHPKSEQADWTYTTYMDLEAEIVELLSLDVLVT